MEQQNSIKNVADIVGVLKKFAARFNIRSLFLGGEFCRLFHFGQANDASTLDVICTDEGQHDIIGTLFATEEVDGIPEKPSDLATVVKVDLPKKSVSLVFQDKSLENYLEDGDIKKWLADKKVDIDVPIIHNLAGRHFTIDTILYSISDNKFHDITEQGMKDLNNRQLSTLLPSKMLFSHKPVVIFDTIKLSLKHDLYIDSEIINSIEMMVPEIESFINSDRIIKEIIGILTINPSKGLELLTKFHLDKYLMHPDIKAHL